MTAKIKAISLSDEQVEVVDKMATHQGMGWSEFTRHAYAIAAEAIGFKWPDSDMRRGNPNFRTDDNPGKRKSKQ